MNSIRGSAFAGAGMAATAIVSSAGANYSGLSIEAIAFTASTLVLRLYANFTHFNDAVVNVFNANISFSQPVLHNEPFGLPPAALLANVVPDTADAFDSWVSIGLSPDNNGGTSLLDPNFNGCDGCFADGGAIVNNAGWFNSNPPNNQGLAGADKKVELAQFAFSWPPDPQRGFLAISGAIWLTTTVGTFTNQGVNASFPHPPPSPGALPLLGLAALAGSSRRRKGG